ncbi:MAG: flagellar export protein FliJ [Lachnospiraceae bacterium]|nr:flagellar export protein FliJ [Lachnospiraceae bacterium]
MKKFIFGLQGVLEIKEKLEGQAKVDFGIARAALTAEEEKLEELKAKRASYLEQMRLTVEGTLKISEINRLKNAISVTDDNIRQQDMAVKRAARQLEIVRVKLNKVVQERKTIEKLREKQFEDYLKEADAEERKETDQLISYRYTVSDED